MLALWRSAVSHGRASSTRRLHWGRAALSEVPGSADGASTDGAGVDDLEEAYNEAVKHVKQNLEVIEDTTLSDKLLQKALRLSNVFRHVNHDDIIEFFDGYKLTRYDCMKQVRQWYSSPTATWFVKFRSSGEAKHALLAKTGSMLGPLKPQLGYINTSALERELGKHSIRPKFIGRSIVAYNALGLIRDRRVQTLLENYDVADVAFDRRFERPRIYVSFGTEVEARRAAMELHGEYLDTFRLDVEAL